MVYKKRRHTGDLEKGIDSASIDEDNPSSRTRWLKHLSKAAIPATLILLFLSRPLIGLVARNTCYYFQDDVGIWPNPLRWAIHSTTSVYKCEWIGHWGFNWPGTLSWLGSIGSSLLTPLSVLGGGYATWKSVKAWANQKNMSPEDREKLKVLSQMISVRTEEDLNDSMSFPEALQFSERADFETSCYSLESEKADYGYRRQMP